MLLLCLFGSTPGLASDRPFAMCSNIHILSSPEYSEKMIDAGARMCRTDLIFPYIRPTPEINPDRWTWTNLDQIRKLKTQHPELDWLGLLGLGSKWAEDPNLHGKTLRDITFTPVISPKNVYGNYVYECVNRYKDVVHYWESWNEPDLPGYAFFTGSGADFFPYQKACYLAAKTADPNCHVLFAGLCYANIEGYLHTHGLHGPTLDPPASSFFEDYLKACVKDPDAKRNNYYFDIMNQHSYSRATDMYDYVSVDRQLMRTYLNGEKPIWVTEMGFPDVPGTWGGTADEYCDYVLQSFAWSKVGGVEKLFHFQLDNSNGHGLYSGMLGPPKPVLTTYRDVLTKYFSDAQLVAQLHGNKGVGFLQDNSPYRHTWTKGYDLFEFKGAKSNRRILMAFTDTEKPVDIMVAAKTDKAILIDRHGNSRVVVATDGVYKLHLPAPQIMLDGQLKTIHGRRRWANLNTSLVAPPSYS